MPRPSASQRKALRAAAVPVALLASGALVWQGSYAAFTAETSADAAWESGTVVLSNTYESSAMFDVPLVRPGDFGSRCVTVTNNSDYDGDVQFYAPVTVTPGGSTLGSDMQVTITRGTDCTAAQAVGAVQVYSTGSMSGLPAAAAASASDWTGSAPGSTQAYFVSWSLPLATTESAAASSLEAAFTWKLVVAPGGERTE